MEHRGFCPEAKDLPDSSNHPNSPSMILEPGKRHRSVKIHKFPVK